MQIAFRQAKFLDAPDDTFKLHSAMKIFGASLRLMPCALAGVPQAGVLGGFGQLDGSDLAHAGLTLDAEASTDQGHAASVGRIEREFDDVVPWREHGSFECHDCALPITDVFVGGVLCTRSAWVIGFSPLCLGLEPGRKLQLPLGLLFC
jgi:hypothetical protein